MSRSHRSALFANTVVASAIVSLYRCAAGIDQSSLSSLPAGLPPRKTDGGIFRRGFAAVATLISWEVWGGRDRHRGGRLLNLQEYSEIQSEKMSDCGNCDCADKSQCTKKRGFQVDGVVETSSPEEVCASRTVAMENDCDCGPNCKCNDCSCHR